MLNSARPVLEPLVTVTLFPLDEKYSTTRLVTKEKPVIENNPDDKFETVLFLPPVDGRKGEGGLRTQGYFKTSLPDKPLITIITVVFNGAEHLEQTILSVIEQSYDNVEYIIIDGGSTDSTLDIIRKYESAIDYWVSEPDGGIYHAMNKGLKSTKGDFTNFLNSADTIFSTLSLSEVVKELTNMDRAYFARAKINGMNTNWLFPPLKVKSIKQAVLWSKKYLPNHQSIFFPRCFYQTNLYDESFKICGDTEYKLRYLQEYTEFIFIDTIICDFKLGGVSNRANNLKNVRTQCQEQIKLLEIYRPERILVQKASIVCKLAIKYLTTRVLATKDYEKFLLLANQLRK